MLNYQPNYKLQIIDGWRHFFLSGLLPIVETIAMLMAIHFFKSSIFEKTFLAVVLKSGLLFGIPLSILTARFKWRINIVLSFLSLMSCLFLFQIYLYQYYYFFLFIALLMSFVTQGTHPIQAEIYRLWSKKNRGSRFITTIFASTLGSILMAWIYGLLTKKGVSGYHLSFGLAALFLGVSSFFSYKLPPIRFSEKQKIDFSMMIKILLKDKLFAYMCLVWFIFGVANLWLLAYRTNYLSESRFGFEYSVKVVIVLLVVIPEGVRVLFLPLFAYLFDRINFVVLRIILNIFLMLYPFFLFVGSSFFLHILGLICYGIAISGSSIAWKLWVNKIAPAEKVALYMTIHSGLTGIRMALSPLIGLVGLISIGPSFCGWISVGLTFVSILMLIPMVKEGKGRFNY